MKAGTAVLMYHRVSTLGAAPVEGDYAIPSALFEEHMERLAQLAVPVVGLKTLEEPSQVPRVVITFDDGWESDATVALPALRRRGFTASFFINPARVGEPGQMSWAQVSQLHDAGMLVGSHGLDHKLLDGIETRELERQLGESKLRLEQRLGEPVRALSLPGGSGGRRAVAFAHTIGYRWILGSRPGLAHRTGALPMPRFAVRAGHDADDLEAIVTQRVGPRLRLALRWRLTRLLRAGLGPRGYERLREYWVSRRETGH